MSQRLENTSASLVVENPTVDDAAGIFEVMKAGFLAAYPNQEHAVSRDAIAAMFEKGPAKLLKRIKRRLEKPDHSQYKYWVARKNAQIVGYCFAVYHSMQGPLIHALYVVPDQHGNGVGKALLDQALVWFGAVDVSLETASYNRRAIAFYLKNGFDFIPDTKQLEYPGATIPIRTMVRKVVRNDNGYASQGASSIESINDVQ